MTNQERLDKLKQAEKLIREVEFSYEIGSDIRRMIYRTVVNTFGFGGSLEVVSRWIKDEITNPIEQE